MITFKTVGLAVGTLVFAAGLAGCGTEPDDAPTEDVQPEGTVYEVGRSDIYEIDVDGTRCIIYEGDRWGGISCDFSNDIEGTSP